MWRVTKIENHPDGSDGIMLSLRMPKSGYNRGGGHTDFLFTNEEAQKLAREIGHAIGG